MSCFTILSAQINLSVHVHFFQENIWAFYQLSALLYPLSKYYFIHFLIPASDILLLFISFVVTFDHRAGHNRKYVEK